MSEKTKRFWWLKLREGFFDQTVIKKLRRTAGGDTYTIIYLKMQLLSLRNEGVILFENVEETLYEELALKLDEAEEDVQFTLLFLEKHKLIEVVNDREYMLPEAVKNMDSESDSAARMRNMRERRQIKSSQCNALPSQCAHSNVTCDTEREKEREKDIDISLSSDDDKTIRMDYQKIVDQFNSVCRSLPKVQSITDKRKKAMRAADKHLDSIGGFHALFEKVEQSDFLTGRSGSWSGCGFDWILKPANMTKIMEGNYDNRESGNQPDYTAPEQYENIGWGK